MLDRWAEEIVEIADDATNDWMDRKSGEHTIAVADTEHINRSRLRIDTRKWLMSKLAPKRYGERVEQVMSGSIAVSRVERVIVDHASDRNGPGLSPLTPALKI
jgi:hypothetical protein